MNIPFLEAFLKNNIQCQIANFYFLSSDFFVCVLVSIPIHQYADKTEIMIQRMLCSMPSLLQKTSLLIMNQNAEVL